MSVLGVKVRYRFRCRPEILQYLYFFNTDIDECTANSSTCEQLCSNTIGSFVCSCMDGYRLNITDNSTCDGTQNTCIFGKLYIDSLTFRY